MINIKKDLTIIYMFRNGIATFLIALVAFVYHVMEYYHISIMQSISRVFMHNIYTILYFLLVWFLNYALFEIYKIGYDICKDKLDLKLRLVIFIAIPLIMMGVMTFILPSLFNVNGILLGVFMIARTVRRMIKQK